MYRAVGGARGRDRRTRNRNSSSRASVSGGSLDPDLRVRPAGNPASGVSSGHWVLTAWGGGAMRQKHYLEAAARKLQDCCPGQARYLL